MFYLFANTIVIEFGECVCHVFFRKACEKKQKTKQN